MYIYTHLHIYIYVTLAATPNKRIYKNTYFDSTCIKRKTRQNETVLSRDEYLGDRTSLTVQWIKISTCQHTGPEFKPWSGRFYTPQGK